MDPAIVTVMEAGVAIIDKVMQLIKDSQSGSLDPKDALAQIQSMSGTVSSNDAAATAAEDTKFGRST